MEELPLLKLLNLSVKISELQWPTNLWSQQFLANLMLFHCTMALDLNDLGPVYEEMFEARTKWYDIGLKLRVKVDFLDSIQSQSSKPKDCLRRHLNSG